MTAVGNTEATELKRGLKSRHIQLIALGGAIGTGLFLGIAQTIKMAGPSVLLGYGIAGVIAFLIMRQLGEMVVDEPVAGSFSYFADKYCGHLPGFLSGWNYWVLYVLVSMAELTAVGIYVQYWWPGVPTWVSALVFFCVINAISLLNVKAFGEMEFWFALIKVVAIIGMIVFGAYLLASGDAVAEQHGRPRHLDGLRDAQEQAGADRAAEGDQLDMAAFQPALEFRRFSAAHCRHLVLSCFHGWPRPVILMHERHNKEGKTCCTAGRPAASGSGGLAGDDGRLVDRQKLGRQSACAAATEFDAHQLPAPAHDGGAVACADQLEAPFHAGAAIAGAQPGGQVQGFAFARGQQVVVFAAADRHRTVEPAVVFQVQPQRL